MQVDYRRLIIGMLLMLSLVSAAQAVTFSGRAPEDGQEWKNGEPLGVDITDLLPEQQVKMLFSGQEAPVTSTPGSENTTVIRLDQSQFSTANLSSGSEYEIQVLVESENNIVAQDSWSVIFMVDEPPVDAQPPVITVTSPIEFVLDDPQFLLEITTSESATCDYIIRRCIDGSCIGPDEGPFSDSDSTTHSQVIDLRNHPRYEPVGTYQVSTSCTDPSQNTGISAFNLTLNFEEPPVNETNPPEWVVAPTSKTFQFLETILYPVSAQDPDDDVLNYSVQTDSAFVTMVENVITITPPVNFTGSINANVSVTDGIYMLSEAIVITITNAPVNNTNSTNTTNSSAPPVRLNPSPSGTLSRGTTEATLSLSTDENAICRYTGTSGTAFSNMTNFTATGGTTHTALLSGLSNGGVYTYFVRCRDTQGNTNPDEMTISFDVQKSSSGGGSSGGSRRRSGGGGGIVPANWTCSEWSVCEDGEQTQTCTRGSSRRTNTQNCTVVPPRQNSTLSAAPIVPTVNSTVEVIDLDAPTTNATELDTGLSAVTGAATELIESGAYDYRKPIKWLLIGWALIFVGVLAYGFRKRF